MSKLTWILNGFINKELYAPYNVKRDIDYYKNLSEKYKILYKSAEMAGADKESLKILKNSKI